MKNVFILLVLLGMMISCNRKNKVVIVCFLLLFLCACKKTKIEPYEYVVFDLSGSCESNYESNTFSTYTYANNYKQWMMVNPNNENEIFYTQTEGFGDSKFYSVQRQSMLPTLLLDYDMVFPPKYGKTGHLLFIGKTDTLYSIKPNGDSLVSKGTKSTFCTWNFDCSKFLYLVRDSASGIDNTIIQDFYTNIKDTLNMDLGNGTWQNERNLYLQTSNYSSPSGFKITDINSVSVSILPYPFDILQTSVFSLTWISKNEFVFANANSVNRYNIETGAMVKLVKFCFNNRPTDIAYSYKSNELFILNSKYENIGGVDNVLISTPNLLVINLNKMSLSELYFLQ